jgi:hypothetical protein
MGNNGDDGNNGDNGGQWWKKSEKSEKNIIEKVGNKFRLKNISFNDQNK